MNREIDALRHRLQELESMALEYARLEHLTAYAAQGHDMALYSGQSVLLVDPETTRILEANPPALELLGYTREELLSLSIPDLEIRIEEWDTVRTYVETAIEEQVYPGIYRHHLGYELPVQVYKRLAQRDGNKLLHYRLEDRSLHKRLWHELQRREDDGFKFQQKLQALNEITLELSRVATYDALCRDAIRLGRERLGFDRLGMWFLDADRGLMVGSYGVDEHGNLRSEQEQSWFYNDTYIEDFIAGKTETSQAHDDVPIYNEKSEIIQFGWHISAPMLHGTRFIGLLSADNFLHQQPMKSYEPELLRLYGITMGHLTELARTRDQAIAVQLAQERTRMLRQFVMNVGHDFKTPLAVINTSTYLIQRTTEADQRRMLGSGINQQVHYISRMLDRMLEFIQLESDVTLALVATDLGVLLTELVDAQQVMIADKHIRCEMTLGEAPSVLADPHYLRSALGEILGNAVRYTPNGGRIGIRLARYPGEVGVRIQDSGPGIEKEALAAIFMPLYRIDQARTERRNGLGLAIAKSIVQAHRGRILVESILGAGSTFEVILPLAYR